MALQGLQSFNDGSGVAEIVSQNPYFGAEVGAATFGVGRRTVAASSGNGLTVYGGGATSGSTDKNGGALTLQGGLNTGAGTGGSIVLQTAPAGSTGTTDGTQTTRLTLDSKGNVVVGTAAVATTATDGFLAITSCAGTPTGTVTTFTGRVQLVYDTTAHKLWANDAGTWKFAAFT